MSEPLILYDIPNTLDTAEKAWSPNTLKIRYTLNYKRIPYRTVWVDYPDIKTLSLDIGAPPTSYDAAGEGEYTLPTIRDPNTSEVVTNSMDIAVWLDKRFPERKVMPVGTAALQVAWHGALYTHVHRPMYALVEYGIFERLPRRSQEYWRWQRQEGGRTLEQKAPQGEERKETMESLKKGLGHLAGYMNRNRKGSVFVMEDIISYADFIMASWLMWAKRALPAKEFEEMISWDDGRWSRLLDALRQYESVDEGETYQPRPMA